MNSEVFDCLQSSFGYLAPLLILAPIRAVNKFILFILHITHLALITQRSTLNAFEMMQLLQGRLCGAHTNIIQIVGNRKIDIIFAFEKFKIYPRLLDKCPFIKNDVSITEASGGSSSSPRLIPETYVMLHARVEV